MASLTLPSSSVKAEGHKKGFKTQFQRVQEETLHGCPPALRFPRGLGSSQDQLLVRGIRHLDLQQISDSLAAAGLRVYNQPIPQGFGCAP